MISDCNTFCLRHNVTVLFCFMKTIILTRRISMIFHTYSVLDIQIIIDYSFPNQTSLLMFWIFVIVQDHIFTPGLRRRYLTAPKLFVICHLITVDTLIRLRNVSKY